MYVGTRGGQGMGYPVVGGKLEPTWPPAILDSSFPPNIGWLCSVRSSHAPLAATHPVCPLHFPAHARHSACAAFVLDEFDLVAASLRR